MDEYIIWLKSGECITGIALETDLKPIIAFGRKKIRSKYISFSDNEGTVMVRTASIDAVGITPIKETSKCGF